MTESSENALSIKIITLTHLSDSTVVQKDSKPTVKCRMVHDTDVTLVKGVMPLYVQTETLREAGH